MFKKWYKEGTPMWEHLKYYRTKNQELTGLENEMEDRDLAFLVLFSLPHGLYWQNIVSTIIETTHMITFDLIESQLLCQAEVLQLDNPSTPPTNSPQMGGIVLAASNEGQCVHCLRSLTHKSEDCYGAGGPKQQNRNTNRQGASPGGANTSSMNFANASSANLALNLNPQPFCSNHAFLIHSDPEAIPTETQMILDSGCTTHACPH